MPPLVSETVINAVPPFLVQSLIIDLPPPSMCLLHIFRLLLIPWLGTQDVVEDLDFFIPPDRLMNIPQCLQCIVNVWQWYPASCKEV